MWGLVSSSEELLDTMGSQDDAVPKDTSGPLVESKLMSLNSCLMSLVRGVNEEWKRNDENGR